jgi:hypothetical protein
MKIITELNKFFFDNMPTLFEEKLIKAIKARYSIRVHEFDNIRNFLFGERLHQRRYMRAW